MRIGIIVIFIALFFSCNSTKELAEKQEPAKYTQMKVGQNTYVFQQNITDSDCSFHSLEENELISFLELNHSGDRDDKLPKKIASLPPQLSKQKTVTKNLKLQVKICYTNTGQVVAFRHETYMDAKKIEEALFAITFEKNVEEACVECTTSYFYVIE